MGGDSPQSIALGGRRMRNAGLEATTGTRTLAVVRLENRANQGCTPSAGQASNPTSQGEGDIPEPASLRDRHQTGNFVGSRGFAAFPDEPVPV